MGRQRLYVNDRGDCVMHDSGFSWIAAFFLPVWALQKRLYVLALIAFVVNGALSYYADTRIQIMLGGAQIVLSGLLANRVHGWLLERRGWRVTAEEPEQSVKT